MQIIKPKFWDLKQPNYIANILKYFSFPFTINNKINFRKKKISKIKSICVGNIYVGGTGKTPVCIMINEILKNLKLRTVFIKKFYKNQTDEQKILKNNGKLISLKNRIDSLKYAKKKKFQVAIIDDGLQEKKIDYDLKIVCFNSKSGVGNGLVMPAGPLREPLISLKNYHLCIINGNYKNNENLKKKLKRYNKKLKIFDGKYKVITSPKIDKKKKFLAFSGIGNHATFLETLKKNKFKIMKNIQFPDHYNYKATDLIELKKKAKLFNLKIITTEKDYLRINRNLKKNINYLKIKITIKQKKLFTKYLLSYEKL